MLNMVILGETILELCDMLTLWWRTTNNDNYTTTGTPGNMWMRHRAFCLKYVMISSPKCDKAARRPHVFIVLFADLGIWRKMKDCSRQYGSQRTVNVIERSGYFTAL